MENFTPVASSIGGILIGLSSAAMLLFNGKIAGISGITGGLLGPHREGDVGWRVSFVLGMMLTGVVLSLLIPAAFAFELDRSTGALIAAGLLVGVGTRIGNGCTSGHGVCGLSRMSGRSLAAVLTFMTTGALTVVFVRLVFGGTP